MLVNLLPHGLASPTVGLLGGGAGGQASLHIEGGAVSEGGGISRLIELREPKDLITVSSAGGSGFGDPRHRRSESLQQDLREEYVTEEGLAAYMEGRSRKSTSMRPGVEFPVVKPAPEKATGSE